MNNTASLAQSVRSSAQKGDLPALEKAISDRAPLDVPDDYGSTALMVAINARQAAAAKLLLENGAGPNRLRKDGMAPLHMAVSVGNLEIIQMLFEHGAQIDARNQEGMTPLLLAVAHRQREAVTALVEAGANPWVRRNDGLTAIAFASEQRDDEVLAKLIVAAKKFKPGISFGKTLKDAFTLGIQAVQWAVRKENDAAAYEALRDLHIATSARAHEIVHSAYRRLRPPRPFPTTQGILGEMNPARLAEICGQIEREGYYVFPDRIDEALCDRLVAHTLSIPATLVPAPETGDKMAVYDRANPLAPQYVIPEPAVLESEEFQKIISDHSVLTLVQAYMGSQPALKTFTVWWSTANGAEVDRKKLSQLFHFDSGCFKILHFFIYLVDVGGENGAHQFVSPSHKAGDQPLALLEAHGGSSLTEGAILAHYGRDSIKEIHGKRGTIMAVDSRGFHRGKPLVSGDRLLLSMFFSDSSFPLLRSQKVGEIALSKDLHSTLLEMVRKFPRVYRRYREV